VVAGERTGVPRDRWPVRGDEPAYSVAAVRRRFPPRPRPETWPQTRLNARTVLDRLDTTGFRAENPLTQKDRRLGADRWLTWLASFPGTSWQQRWLASGQEALSGADWELLPRPWLTRHGLPDNRRALSSGLSILICTDVIRPSGPWLITRRSRRLTEGMAAYRDPDGFAALDQAVRTDPALTLANAQPAKARIAVILASKGGLLRDITVGDCIEFYDLHTQLRPAGAPGKALFYSLLHRLGIFPVDAPATLRAVCGPAQGQKTVTQLVDRYHLQPGPIRDLIIDYLTERRPGLDYSTLTGLARDLAGLFWADLERHHPGIACLQLPPDVAVAWKERLKTKTRTVTDPATGRRSTVVTPRGHTAGPLASVRAFYLDIAQWALEEPARWGPWAAPCPIRACELSIKKENQRVKARMDARTRERLPVLPTLVDIANTHRRQARERLRAAEGTPPGDTFSAGGQTLLRPRMYRDVNARVWAQDPVTGARRDLTLEESDAFWAWAVVEVLSRTGIRIEELLELTHQAINSYRLPATGEVVPLLQIAPSKTDTERLLLVDPELADVLSAIISRIRTPTGAVPLVPAYDHSERTWLPPMALLFQHVIGGDRHAFHPGAIYQILGRTLNDGALTDAAGQPLRFTPHDFRRMFVTDVVMNGLPPHIAQVICGHANIATTMGYKAVYPTEAIEAHRAFIARRRTLRPGSEYRTPTDQEWDTFLASFERRKVSVGTCARAFNTPCIHEHACIRCPVLRPDPTGRPRLEEIRDNLTARIAEAEREGWLGEIEGLQVSLAGAIDKLHQLDTARDTANDTPPFDQIAGRLGTAEPVTN